MKDEVDLNVLISKDCQDVSIRKMHNHTIHSFLYLYFLKICANFFFLENTQENVNGGYHCGEARVWMESARFYFLLLLLCSIWSTQSVDMF